MLLPFLVALSTVQAASCPELTARSAEIRTAIDSVELDEAQRLADRLPADLDCQTSPVAPLALHTALVMAGAAHHFQGEDGEASALFRWAAAVAPTSLTDPALGEGVAELYRAARRAALVQAPATLVVGRGPVWVDGAPRDTHLPLALSPGDHLVQWTHSSGELVTLRVQLDSGEPLHLAGGLLPPPVPVAAAEPGARTASVVRPARAPVARWMRVGGAVGLLAGSGFLVASAQAHRDFDQSQGRAELVSLQQTVNSRTLLGASSAAVGGGLFLSSWSPRLNRGSAP